MLNHMIQLLAGMPSEEKLKMHQNITDKNITGSVNSECNTAKAPREEAGGIKNLAYKSYQLTTTLNKNIPHVHSLSTQYTPPNASVPFSLIWDLCIQKTMFLSVIGIQYMNPKSRILQIWFFTQNTFSNCITI